MTEGRKTKARLIELGITMTAIAKRMGVKVCTVSLAISGKRKSSRISLYVKEVIERGAL
jgi:transcriptional regulator with XRE-family HTH domain